MGFFRSKSGTKDSHKGSARTEAADRESSIKDSSPPGTKVTTTTVTTTTTYTVSSDGKATESSHPHQAKDPPPSTVIIQKPNEPTQHTSLAGLKLSEREASPMSILESADRKARAAQSSSSSEDRTQNTSAGQIRSSPPLQDFSGSSKGRETNINDHRAGSENTSKAANHTLSNDHNNKIDNHQSIAAYQSNMGRLDQHSDTKEILNIVPKDQGYGSGRSNGSESTSTSLKSDLGSTSSGNQRNRISSVATEKQSQTSFKTNGTRNNNKSLDTSFKTTILPDGSPKTKGSQFNSNADHRNTQIQNDYHGNSESLNDSKQKNFSSIMSSQESETARVKSSRGKTVLSPMPSSSTINRPRTPVTREYLQAVDQAMEKSDAWDRFRKNEAGTKANARVEPNENYDQSKNAISSPKASNIRTNKHSKNTSTDWSRFDHTSDDCVSDIDATDACSLDSYGNNEEVFVDAQVCLADDNADLYSGSHRTQKMQHAALNSHPPAKASSKLGEAKKEFASKTRSVNGSVEQHTTAQKLETNNNLTSYQNHSAHSSTSSQTSQTKDQKTSANLNRKPSQKATFNNHSAIAEEGNQARVVRFQAPGTHEVVNHSPTASSAPQRSSERDYGTRRSDDQSTDFGVKQIQHKHSPPPRGPKPSLSEFAQIIKTDDTTRHTSQTGAAKIQNQSQKNTSSASTQKNGSGHVERNSLSSNASNTDNESSGSSGLWRDTCSKKMQKGNSRDFIDSDDNASSADGSIGGRRMRY